MFRKTRYEMRMMVLRAETFDARESAARGGGRLSPLRAGVVGVQVTDQQFRLRFIEIT